MIISLSYEQGIILEEALLSVGYGAVHRDEEWKAFYIARDRLHQTLAWEREDKARLARHLTSNQG